MTLYQKVQSAIVLGALLAVAGVVPASAQGNDTTELNLELTPGTRTITSAASATLSAVEITNVLATSSGDVLDTTIVDTTGSLSGWAANVKFTNLVGATTASKIILLASDVTANFGSADQYLRVTPSGQTTVSGNSAGLTTPTSQVTITALDTVAAGGESNTFALISASSTNGNGTYTVDTGIEIDIPAYALYPSPTDMSLTAQNYVGTATYAVS
jgi:hypothetical protein